MSAIVAALGVGGNLWSALRSAPPPLHPVRSLSQEGTRTRTSGSSSRSSSVVGESILSESDPEEAVGKLLRFRILPRRIHWCVWTFDDAQTEAVAGACTKKDRADGPGGCGKTTRIGLKTPPPPPLPIHELVGRCWEEEWIPLSPPALHRHRLLKTMNGVSFSLLRPSLCVSLSLCFHPHLFLSCDPMNFGLYMYLCVWPEERGCFYARGGRRSGTIRGFNLGICCLLLL
jgi:hypothetical protein